MWWYLLFFLIKKQGAISFHQHKRITTSNSKQGNLKHRTRETKNTKQPSKSKIDGRNRNANTIAKRDGNNRELAEPHSREASSK